jgi:hypothetical protein
MTYLNLIWWYDFSKPEHDMVVVSCSCDGTFATIPKILIYLKIVALLDKMVVFYNTWIF